MTVTRWPMRLSSYSPGGSLAVPTWKSNETVAVTGACAHTVPVATNAAAAKNITRCRLVLMVSLLFPLLNWGAPMARPRPALRVPQAARLPDSAQARALRHDLKDDLADKRLPAPQNIRWSDSAGLGF